MKIWLVGVYLEVAGVSVRVVSAEVLSAGFVGALGALLRVEVVEGGLDALALVGVVAAVAVGVPPHAGEDALPDHDDQLHHVVDPGFFLVGVDLRFAVVRVRVELCDEVRLFGQFRGDEVEGVWDFEHGVLVDFDDEAHLDFVGQPVYAEVERVSFGEQREDFPVLPAPEVVPLGGDSCEQQREESEGDEGNEAHGGEFGGEVGKFYW